MDKLSKLVNNNEQTYLMISGQTKYYAYMERNPADVEITTPGETLDDRFLLTLCLGVSEWNMLFYNSSKAKPRIQLSTGSGHHLYVQI